LGATPNKSLLQSLEKTPYGKHKIEEKTQINQTSMRKNRIADLWVTL